MATMAQKFYLIWNIQCCGEIFVISDTNYLKHASKLSLERLKNKKLKAIQCSEIFTRLEDEAVK